MYESTELPKEFRIDEGLGLVLPDTSKRIAIPKAEIVRTPKLKEEKHDFEETGGIIRPKANGISVQEQRLLQANELDEATRTKLESTLVTTKPETNELSPTPLEIARALTAPEVYFEQKIAERLGDQFGQEKIQAILAKNHRVHEYGLMYYARDWYLALDRQLIPDEEIKYYFDRTKDEKVPITTTRTSIYEAALTTLAEVATTPEFANTKVGLRALNILDGAIWEAKVGKKNMEDRDEEHKIEGNRKLELTEVAENLITLLETNLKLDMSRSYDRSGKRAVHEKGTDVKHVVYKILEQLDLSEPLQTRVLEAMDSREDLNNPLAFKIYVDLAEKNPEAPFVLEQQERHEKILELLGNPDTSKVAVNFEPLMELTKGLVMPFEYTKLPRTTEDFVGRIGIELEVTEPNKAYAHTSLKSTHFILGQDSEGNGEIRNALEKTYYSRGYVKQLALLTEYIEDNFPHVSSLHMHVDNTLHHVNLQSTYPLDLWNKDLRNNPLGTWEIRDMLPPLEAPSKINTASLAGQLEMVAITTRVHKNPETPPKPAEIALREFAGKDNALDIGFLAWTSVVNKTQNAQARLSTLFALKDRYALTVVNEQSLLKTFLHSEQLDTQTNLENKFLVLNTLALKLPLDFATLETMTVPINETQAICNKYGLSNYAWEMYKLLSVRTDYQSEKFFSYDSRLKHTRLENRNIITDMVLTQLEEDPEKFLYTFQKVAKPQSKEKGIPHNYSGMIHLFRSLIYQRENFERLKELPIDSIKMIENFLELSKANVNKQEYPPDPIGDDLTYIFQNWDSYCKFEEQTNRKPPLEPISAKDRVEALKFLEVMPYIETENGACFENMDAWINKVILKSQKPPELDTETITTALEENPKALVHFLNRCSVDAKKMAPTIKALHKTNNPELSVLCILNDFGINDETRTRLTENVSKLLQTNPQEFEHSALKYLEENEDQMLRILKKMLLNKKLETVPNEYTDTVARITKTIRSQDSESNSYHYMYEANKVMYLCENIELVKRATKVIEAGRGNPEKVSDAKPAEKEAIFDLMENHVFTDLVTSNANGEKANQYTQEILTAHLLLGRGGFFRKRNLDATTLVLTQKSSVKRHLDHMRYNWESIGMGEPEQMTGRKRKIMEQTSRAYELYGMYTDSATESET